MWTTSDFAITSLHAMDNQRIPPSDQIRQWIDRVLENGMESTPGPLETRPPGRTVGGAGSPVAPDGAASPHSHIMLRQFTHEYLDDYDEVICSGPRNCMTLL